MRSIIGVEALNRLSEGTFQLRTHKELEEMSFGPFARKILRDVVLSPIDQPIRAKEIAKKVGLTEKQANRSLEYMVNRKDQVFTKFKDPDVLQYSLKLSNNRVPNNVGWFREAIMDLDEAIEDLGESYLAIRLERLFSSYDKLPWNYIPLIKYHDKPIYCQMQLQILRMI